MTLELPLEIPCRTGMLRIAPFAVWNAEIVGPIARAIRFRDLDQMARDLKWTPQQIAENRAVAISTPITFQEENDAFWTLRGKLRSMYESARPYYGPQHKTPRLTEEGLAAMIEDVHATFKGWLQLSGMGIKDGEGDDETSAANPTGPSETSSKTDANLPPP